MTTLHQSDIRQRLARYLDRRVTPRHLEGKPDALRDEIEAIARKVARAAPSADALPDWWQAFTDYLDEHCSTRAWPSVAEVSAACKAAGSGMPVRNLTGDAHPDDARSPYERDARRMKAGEPVGEQALWGRAAVYIQRNGLIDPDTMRRYRRAYYAEMVRLWGEDVAKTTLDAMRLRQRAAEEAYDQHQNRSAHRANMDGQPWQPDMRISFPADL